MAGLQDFRAQHPEYNDMDDLTLSTALYKKYYSDMPREEYDAKMGVKSPGVVSNPSPAFTEALAKGSENTQRLAPSAQKAYEGQLANIRTKYYPQVDDAKWAEIVKTQFQPYNSGDLAREGLMFGLQDEVSALSGATADALMGKDFGQSFQDWQALEAARRNLGKEQAGGWGTAAEIGGAIVGGGAPNLVANALSRGAPLGAKVAQGASDAATQGFLYGMGSADGDLAERGSAGLQSAVLSAPLGGAAAGVGHGIGSALATRAQNRAVNNATRNAPGAADLGAAASQMFRQVDQSGVAVSPNVFQRFADRLTTRARADRLNQTLDPRASGAFQELTAMAEEASQAGRGLTISELHTMRQIAQRAAVSTEGRDAMFANRIVDGLDDLIGGLRPADMVGGAGNQVGNTLLQAISTWGRSRRTALIEEAVYRAQNQASGFENGLRTQFRAILNNQARRRLFNDQEIAAIERVANGTGLSNVTRLLGMFGFDFGSGRNFLGGAIGFGLGGIPGAVGGALARRASEQLTRNSADRVARLVATENIPQLPALPPMPGSAIAGRLGMLPSTQVR